MKKVYKNDINKMTQNLDNIINIDAVAEADPDTLQVLENYTKDKYIEKKDKVIAKNKNSDYRFEIDNETIKNHYAKKYDIELDYFIDEEYNEENKNEKEYDEYGEL